MMKLAGSVCVLAGGCLAWQRQHRERRRRRQILGELLAALVDMDQEIRMARTPLPELLDRLAGRCRSEAEALLRETARAARRGEGLTAAWRRGIRALPLAEEDLEILAGLDLQGDEEKVRKALSLVHSRLEKHTEELDRRRPEEEKRAMALCFSAAALLVILLI